MRFLERKRRKAWIVRGEEEVCWEVWTVKVTVAEPKTDNGELNISPSFQLCSGWKEIVERQRLMKVWDSREGKSPASYGADAPRRRPQDHEVR